MVPSEYEHAEYKQSLAEIKAIVESIAAFATAGGGTIRIGMHPDGRRVGVLAYVREHGGITRARYREIFHVSYAQAGRDLRYLVDHGLLTREGQGPAAHYSPRGGTKD